MAQIKLILTIIFLCVVIGLLTIGALVIGQMLPIPTQLKVALSFILAIFVWWLGILKLIKFFEKSLIKNKI